MKRALARGDEIPVWDEIPSPGDFMGSRRILGFFLQKLVGFACAVPEMAPSPPILYTI